MTGTRRASEARRVRVWRGSRELRSRGCRSNARVGVAEHGLASDARPLRRLRTRASPLIEPRAGKIEVSELRDRSSSNPPTRSNNSRRRKEVRCLGRSVAHLALVILRCVHVEQRPHGSSRRENEPEHVRRQHLYFRAPLGRAPANPPLGHNRHRKRRARQIEKWPPLDFGRHNVARTSGCHAHPVALEFAKPRVVPSVEPSSAMTTSKSDCGIV